MGKVFGVLSLVFGLLALLAGWAIQIFVTIAMGPTIATYMLYGICGLAIVFGIIGIIKDDSKGLGIAGLILGIIALILWQFLWIIIAVILFAGLMGGLGL